LTGESTAVAKHGDVLPEDTLLAERCNMAYAGT
jgi:magnesium-transporting ATPase (P-type)